MNNDQFTKNKRNNKYITMGDASVKQCDMFRYIKNANLSHSNLPFTNSNYWQIQWNISSHQSLQHNIILYLKNNNTVIKFAASVILSFK